MTCPNEYIQRVNTVVVPAAGLGTRFLPATKRVPKELLPVVDTPGIELIAEEAAQLGARRLVIITAPQKQEVLAHFRPYPELEKTLLARGKKDLYEKVIHAEHLIDTVAVEQKEPLGLGHAVGLAEKVMDKNEDVVAVILPDDLVLPMGIMTKMAAVRAEYGGSVLCACEVPRDEVSKYGVFAIEESTARNVKRVTGMVEKPDVADAPSHYVATGRYLLDREIFDALRTITPGKGGELQLTDAIELLIEQGHPVHIVVHQGKRHDLGNPGGYIAACVDFGLRNPEYSTALHRELVTLLKEYDDQAGQ